MFSYWLTFVLFFNKFFFKTLCYLKTNKRREVALLLTGRKGSEQVAKFDRRSKWATYSSSCVLFQRMSHLQIFDWLLLTPIVSGNDKALSPTTIYFHFSQDSNSFHSSRAGKSNGCSRRGPGYQDQSNSLPVHRRCSSTHSYDISFIYSSSR